MSRTGSKAIAIPDGVTVDLAGAILSVKGPKGLLTMAVRHDVDIQVGDGKITFAPRNDSKTARSMWGTQRALANNLVQGVHEGFERKLEIVGVGYRAKVQGQHLNLQLGYSHDINYPIPEGVAIKCPDQTTILISGIDKQKVGQVASEIRAFRKPEPYKGKGVRYAGEYIFRKEGKKK
ncbi:MAG: 50S ribosomal protein L6 [Proteobacteria bacterium]|nr:50S ribosomal protein L6 [Pseudomonadota bacterium]